jgi:hypothetical protein
VPWQVPAGLTLHFRRVGGRMAVFNEESGDLHLFLPEAAEALRQLQGGARFAHDLLEENPQGGDSQGMGEVMDELLSELNRLGLIEPADG